MAEKLTRVSQDDLLMPMHDLTHKGSLVPRLFFPSKREASGGRALETSLVYGKKRSQLQKNDSFNNFTKFNEKNSLTGNKRQKRLETPATIYCAGKPVYY